MKKLRLLFVALLAFAGVAQAVAQEAYAVVTTNDREKPVSVTFYYDANKASFEGTGVTIVSDLNASNVYQNWAETTLTSATFDASFANYDGLTSLYCWFDYCSSLTSITGLTNLKTGNVTNMNRVFNRCSSLTELDLSSFNTANVTNMAGMFSSCSVLTELDLSNFNTANVTLMGGMFSGCSGLTELDLSSFNTANVTSMASMFMNCSSLKELDLTGFNVSNVTNTEKMFYDCSNLETIYAKGNWATETNTSGTSMFYGCSKLVGGALTQLGVTWDKTYAHVDGGPSNPGYFTDKDEPLPYAVVTKDGDNKPISVAFYYDKLKDTRTGENVTIVRALNNVNIYTNWAVNTLTSATFDSSFANCHVLTRLSDWFSTCSNLTSITGLEHLNTENVTTMKNLFSGCSSLVELDLSHFNTANVTTMERMFYYCSGLTELDLSNFDVSNVTNTSYMFAGCSNLETIYETTDWSTQAISSSSSMFSGCSKLAGGAGTIIDNSPIDKTYARLDGGPTSPGYFSDKTLPIAYAVVTKDAAGNPISLAFFYDNNKSSHVAENVTIVRALNAQNIPEWAGNWNSPSTLTSVTFDPSFASYHGLTSCYYWFYYCQNLTSINGLEYLNTENVTTMDNMFSNCKLLTELDLSNFNTSQVTNMSLMFNSCTNLETIYAGDGWTTEAVQYSSSMFSGDEKLTGGYGTTYNNTFSDKTYACLDGGSASPGYFSKKGDPVPYAVVTKDTEGKPISVAFYYDTQKDTRAGGNITIVRDLKAYSNWSGTTLTSATFDPSFANYHGLTNLNRWFYNCQALTTITGLEYLNTENATTMYSMFYYCKKLTRLDLSGFNTANVTTMENMFYNCTSLTDLDLTGFDVSSVTDFRDMFCDCGKLETIYATEDWNSTSPATYTYSQGMFTRCEKLLGGAMTPYNASYTGKTYARLDGGTSAPGYFSKKGDPLAYAVVTKDTEGKPISVAFYYDTQKDTRAGENITIVRRLISQPNDYAYQNWYGSTLTSVSFDENFAGFEGLTNLYQWFYNCSNLTSITGLEYLNTKNVTTMERMFSGCSSLTALDLSHFNTESLTNTYYMFYNCSLLTDINLTNFTAANVTNMEGMFYYCSGLTELDLSSFDVSNVTSSSFMFSGCSNLESIYATSDWSTKINGTSNGMFSNCSKLCGSAGTAHNNSYTDKTYARLDGGPTSPGYFSQKDVDLAYAVVTKDGDNKPISVAFYYDKLKDTRTGENVIIIRTLNATTAYQNWTGTTLTSVTFDSSFANYRGLTNLNRWFYNCQALTTITGLEYLNTENATTMYSMFYYCKKLTRLDLSGFNTANVTTMENMFYNCDLLTELDLTNFNVSKVTSTNYMFSGCKVLETIYATGDWSAQANSSSKDMFYNCLKLAGGAGTAYNSSYTGNSYAHVDGGPSNPGYFTDKNEPIPYAVVTKNEEGKPVSVAFYYDKLKDTHTGEDATIIRTLNATIAYQNWTGSTLTSVTFDSSFANYRGLTNLYRWFYNCQALTAITGLEFLNTENVTTMESMFYGCKLLTSLDLSQFNTVNVTNMYSMFYGCRGLTSLDLSHFNTANVTSMASMFHLCEGLTSLDVSGFNTTNVATMEYMFHSCSLLTELDLSHFNTANVTTMERMFYNCLGLTELDLTSFDVSNVTNTNSMFYGCSNLEAIYATSDWSEKAISSSSSMFLNCSKLCGSAGTAYNTSYTDKTYARLDGGPTLPGYFSQKNVDLAYAVVTKNAEGNPVSVVFYYDKLKETRGGENITIVRSLNAQGAYQNWAKYTLASATFDPSFANYHGMTRLYYWFNNCQPLTTITGLENLNTENVTTMYGMFSQCTSLTELDVSNFNVSNVTEMSYMFHYCDKLKTIYATANWAEQATGANSSGMFSYCTSLVGGANTTYNQSHADITYAHLDGGTANPGYFTDKNAFLRGDVNGDGYVTIADVTTLVNIILGKNEAPANGVADVNNDTTITIADVTTLVNIILGKE